MADLWRTERGSVLLLVPAGMLVLVVLAAIALDSALAFLGQRELSAAAAAAANDAAGAALSDRAFYRGAGGGGSIEVDRGRAEQVAQEAVRARWPRGVTVRRVSVQAQGPHVCVAVVGEVPYVFSPVVPGVARSAVVRGEARATAVVGEAGTPVPAMSGLSC